MHRCMYYLYIVYTKRYLPFAVYVSQSSIYRFSSLTQTHTFAGDSCNLIKQFAMPLTAVQE